MITDKKLIRFWIEDLEEQLNNKFASLTSMLVIKQQIKILKDIL